MKKIVSIVAVAAVLASSVFAADVSAKVKLDGSLFNLGDKAALKIGHATDEAWNPVIALSTSGDNAGAEVSFYSGNWSGNFGTNIVETPKKWDAKTKKWVDLDEAEKKAYDKAEEDQKKAADDARADGDRDIETTLANKAGFMGGWNNAYVLGAKTYKIWMQPVDMLKFEFGNLSTNLNQEQIDWSKTDSGCDSEGYGLNLFFGPASFTTYLLPGWDNYWFANKACAETYFKFNFGGDFGTINVMFDGKSNFKDDKFGLGYNGNFGGVNAFVNVLGYINGGFSKVRAEVFAKGAAGDFGWAVFVPFEFDVKAKAAALGFSTKLNYQIGAVNAYLYINELINDSRNILKFDNIEVKPGVTGSVGACGWEVAADMTIGKKSFGLNVPVTLTVGF